jgi:hypothetical protein
MNENDSFIPHFYAPMINIDYCNVLVLQQQFLAAETAQMYDRIVFAGTRIDQSLIEHYLAKLAELKSVQAEYDDFMTAFLNGGRDPLAEFQDELDKNGLLRII